MFPIYEEQIQHVIDMQNRKAIKAERLKLARAGKPDPIVAMAMRLRDSISSAILTTHAHNHREPIASPTPHTATEKAAEPTGEMVRSH